MGSVSSHVSESGMARGAFCWASPGPKKNKIRYVKSSSPFGVQIKYVYALPVIELLLRCIAHWRCSYYILHDNKCKLGRKCQIGKVT